MGDSKGKIDLTKAVWAQSACSNPASAKSWGIFHRILKENHQSATVCHSMLQDQHQTVAGRKTKQFISKISREGSIDAAFERWNRPLELCWQGSLPVPKIKCKPGVVQKQLYNDVCLGNWRLTPCSFFGLAKLIFCGSGVLSEASVRQQRYLR